MPLSSFQKQLEDDLQNSVKFTINDNRSTMLSVKWEPHCTKVSLHRFFLNAPENVLNALAGYIKRKDRKIAPAVKTFIEENLNKLDYSQVVNPAKLHVQGETYHLKQLLGDLNQEYFDNTLKLNITWFGKRVQRNRSQVTFGLYHRPLKLIKINRLLDSPKFPPYLVTYVIYHEMLHHVCPSYFDEKGKHRIHNKEFKMLEKKFRHYHEAKQWIEQNRERLFARF
ncbi:MAG: hypothetical protein K940chlam7_01037 [Chlamydiae bacterium]|nr:hypothetical protein [Chlamydiota bacterium]